MAKFYCTECGNELHDDSLNYCDKCGAKITKTTNNETSFCPQCGEKITNGYTCSNCGYSPTKKSYKNFIIIGYILAILGLILPGLAIFGAIIGVYLIYKNYNEVVSGKFNKTSANALLITIFSVIAISLVFNGGFILFEIVAIIILNRVLETDLEGHYSVHVNPKQKLTIVAVILILALFGSLWISGTFSTFTSSGDDSSFIAGGEATVYGKTFTIPQGFVESDRSTGSDFETVTFKNDKGDSFEIHVSSNTNFPLNSKYIKSKFEKTINGMDGLVLYYEPANTQRFLYIDSNGLLVYISPNVIGANDLYDIVVC